MVHIVFPQFILNIPILIRLSEKLKKIFELMDWLNVRIITSADPFRKKTTENFAAFGSKHRKFFEVNFPMFWFEMDTKSLRSFCVGVGIRSFSQSLTEKSEKNHSELENFNWKPAWPVADSYAICTWLTKSG